MPKVLGLNHASFTVPDLDPIVAFFVEGLGYRLVSRGPRDAGLIERMTGVTGADIEIAFVAGPDHRIELIRYHGPADRGAVNPRLCDVGAAHVGLDVDDMEGAVAKAGKHGFQPTGDIITINAGPNKDRRVAYLRNGDGITIELLEARRA